MNDSSELIGGLYPKAKHPNAPDFVIGKLSINVAQFREWMQGHLRDNPGEEWINMDLKEGKSGKCYAQLDTWKPEKNSPPAPPARAAEEDFTDDKLPF